MEGTSPHDDSTRWLVTLFVSLFAGGVGWLVKHLTGRRSEFVQLGLAKAQTFEIRARVRRENESAAVSGLKELAQQLRDDRDYWKARAEKAERRPLEEELHRLPEPPADK